MAAARCSFEGSMGVSVRDASAATVADLLHRLGGIPARRVLADPPPGTATERDLVAYLHAANKRLVELVDGVLIEKPLGWKESLLASLVVKDIWVYLDKHDLGIALTADGPVRLRPRRIRIPDACFVAWGRIPADAERKAVLRAIPNLAVEVYSKSNTRREMEFKLRDYFRAGVELVWIIYPKTQDARVYTPPTTAEHVGKDGRLDRLGVARVFLAAQAPVRAHPAA
jgi:Uma2 family endonuclease